VAFVRRAGALAPCAAGGRPQDKPRSAHRAQFWTLAARDPSIKLVRFLVELASRIRKGEADARERMLAARARVLITVEAAAD